MGASILDPEDGKTYECNRVLEDGGEKPQVLGHVGIALVGRPRWIREERSFETPRRSARGW